MEIIRPCSEQEIEAIALIINEAALVYKGVIPEDRWTEPYMSEAALRQEIEDGVIFWGFQKGGKLVGVMGLQDRGPVALIRHAYVLPEAQRMGIGSRLLRHLESLSHQPLLVGTWADDWWAIAFYRKNGYVLLSSKEKNALLRRYWKIPERQVETSVVLVNRERWQPG
jgi:GNAT superfamily N-acetyltransferase